MEKRLIHSSFYDTLTSILVHRGFAINMVVVSELGELVEEAQ
jgi:hypothetical protein